MSISNTRDNFKKHLGKQVVCYGDIDKFGRALVNFNAKRPFYRLTVCLTEAHFVNGNRVVLSDHVWIKITEMHLNLKIGDTIKFNAEVSEYSSKDGTKNYNFKQVKDIEVYLKTQNSIGQSIVDYYLQVQNTGLPLDFRYAPFIGRLKAQNSKYFHKMKLSEAQRWELERLYSIFVLKKQEPSEEEAKWLRALLESGLDLHSMLQHGISLDCKKLVYEALNKNS